MVPLYLGGGVVAGIVIAIVMMGGDKPAEVTVTDKVVAPGDAPKPVQPDAPVAPPEGMVQIDGATFQMGSSKEEVDDALAWCTRLSGEPCPRELYERELPRHAVMVAPFFLDRTEVTNAAFAAALATAAVEPDPQFVRVAGTRLADLKGPHAGVRRAASGFAAVDQKAGLPVVQITWEGAAWYCASVGKRLPSEAEWELAARGADGRAFPWGNERDVTCEQAIHGRAASRKCLAGDRPANVATAPRDVTPEGVHDLGGNVAEWVVDRFAPYDPACTAGCVASAPVGAAVKRVARGGYFDGLAESLRAAGRSRFDHDAANVNVGVRCAKGVP